MENTEKVHMVLCPPCVEQPLAPEGFNPGVSLPTKRGLLNKEYFINNPPSVLRITSPTGGEVNHSFTQTVVYKNCHSRGMLSGIYTLAREQGGDPRQKPSQMTLNKTTRGFTARYTPQGRYAGYSGRTGFTLRRHAEPALLPLRAALKGCYSGSNKTISASSCSIKGFTLIELLVVVLIIGILAAVAVPQYQHAVLKSRVSSVIPMAQSLAKAQEVYWLTNGEYAESLNELEVQAVEGNAKVSLSPKERLKYVLAYHETVPNAHYIVYQNHSPEFANNIHCEAKSDDEQAQWICEKGLGGTKLDSGRVTKGFTTYILQGSAQDGAFYYTYTSSNAPEHLTDGDTCISCGGGHTYDNESKCLAQSQGGCGGKSHFDNGSICQTDSAHYYGCNQNTFDNQSVCIANHIDTCVGTSFFHGSVCYANAGPATYGTCRGSYDSTSYCAGQHCPAGTPAGDKDGIFAGKCWDGNGNYGAQYCTQS